jgi:hypothetical protein
MALLVALFGFAVGAVGPLILGLKAQQGLVEYAESVRAEGLEVCGLPAIIPMGLLFVATPVCGLIGAVIATGLASVAAMRSLDSTDESSGT